jgi:hypothetical protein
VTPISLGIFASANQSAAATSYESIATVSVGSGGSSSISFTSIPATYTHLQVRGIARLTGAFTYEEYSPTLNSDTGSNYAYHYLQGSGSSAISSGGGNTTAGRSGSWVGGTGLNSSVFGAIIIDILDYSNTNKYTTIRMFGGLDNNGGGYVGIASSLWRSTDAVTTFTLDVPSDFAQYSHFALFGIKGAA